MPSFSRAPSARARLKFCSSGQTPSFLPVRGDQAGDTSGEAATAAAPRGWTLKHAGLQMLAVVLPLLILGLWTLSSVQNVFGPGLLPTPMESAATYLDWLYGESRGFVDPFSGTWWRNVMASSIRVAVGVSIAALVGIVLGILIG